MTENLTLEQDGYHCVADRVAFTVTSSGRRLLGFDKFKLWWIMKHSPIMEGAFDSCRELIHLTGCAHLSALGWVHGYRSLLFWHPCNQEVLQRCGDHSRLQAGQWQSNGGRYADQYFMNSCFDSKQVRNCSISGPPVSFGWRVLWNMRVCLM